MEDGSPAKVKGWMYYDSKHKNGGSSGTDNQYTDRFHCVAPAGQIWLSYYAEGFAPTWAGPFKLVGGERLDDVKLVLRRGGDKRIRVIDEQGEPVKGATLVAHPVINGKADALVYDLPFCGYLYGAQGKGKTVFLSEPFTYEPLAWAINKGDPDFLNFLNNFLRQTRGDGFYDRMYKKYITGTKWKAELE